MRSRVVTASGPPSECGHCQTRPHPGGRGSVQNSHWKLTARKAVGLDLSMETQLPLDSRRSRVYLGAMASRSLNKVMLIGHLGKDAETRHTQSGTAVTNFTLATSWRTKNQQTGEWREETDWHDIVMWRAENVAPYLQKGKQVFVEGRLQTRSWEDQSGNKRYKTEVVAENLILLSSRGDDAGPPPSSEREVEPQQSAAGASAGGEGPGTSAGGESPAASNQGITDDDVPF